MSETPSAGWYPDPDNSSRQRYWTGDEWSEQTRESTEKQKTPPSPGNATDAQILQALQRIEVKLTKFNSSFESRMWAVPMGFIALTLILLGLFVLGGAKVQLVMPGG